MTGARLQGQYFDGQHPLAVPAVLEISGPAAVLHGAGLSQQHPVRRVQVSPRVGRSARFIALPDGGQFLSPDDPVLDRLPQEQPSEGPVAWLEARLAMAIAGIAIIAALLLAGYFYGLPAAAERIARHIPVETERALGQQVLTWLDDNQWFKPTRIDADLRYFIAKDFEDLSRGLPMEKEYRLEFRDAGFIGANAFALPGGTIVITDDMVKAAESLEEVLAVLAHEIGHVERRHTLRHLLQDSAVAVVTTAVTADAASLTVAVAGVPALLARAKYSREFETEADDFGFDLLKRHDRSPEAFATLMERLRGDDEDGERSYAFLSTHPMTAERIRRARAAANP
jgi:predicted Zn-dependent protease